MNKSPDLHQLLTEADREFQPISARPPQISIRVLEEHGHRQRLCRLVSNGVAIALIATAATLWWRNTKVTSTNSPMLVAAEQSLEMLKRQAESAARAGKAWQHNRKTEALRFKYRQLRQKSITAELVSPIEQAARINLTLAQELERQLGAGDCVLTEYRRVVARFPNTQSARVASERLMLIESST